MHFSLCRVSSTASGLEGTSHCIRRFARAGPFLLDTFPRLNGLVFNQLHCVSGWCHRLCSIPNLAFQAHPRASHHRVPFFVLNEICDDRRQKNAVWSVRWSMHCFELLASLWFSFANSDRNRNPICSDVSQIQLDSSVISWLTVMTSLTSCISIIVSPPCGSSSFPAYRGSALVKTMPSGLLPLVFICFPHPSLESFPYGSMEWSSPAGFFFGGKRL